MNRSKHRLVRVVAAAVGAVCLATTAVVVTVTANAATTYTLREGVPISGKLWDSDCANCVPVSDRTAFTYTIPDEVQAGLLQWNFVALRSNYAANYDLRVQREDGTWASSDHGNNGIDYATWHSHNGTMDLTVDQIREHGNAYQYYLSAVVSKPVLNSATETITFTNSRFAAARTVHKGRNDDIVVTVSMADCADRGSKPTAQMLLDFRLTDRPDWLTPINTSVSTKDLTPANDCTYTYRNTGDEPMDLVVGLVNWTKASMTIEVTID
jgi:hypothetical protein